MKNYTNGLSHRSYEGEIWHSIDIQPFDEIYEVSNFGRVRSHHNNSNIPLPLLSLLPSGMPSSCRG